MSNVASLCPACGAESPKLFLDKCSDLLHGCRGEWSLLECERCGVVSLSPMPSAEQIETYYPTDYAPYNPVRSLSTNPAGAFLRKLALLPYTLRYGRAGLDCPPFGQARLLEVGCGAGRFLAVMSGLGWQSTGVDISPRAIEAAQVNAPGAVLHLGTLEDVPVSAPYDLVVMSHVLEHLRDPVDCLERCFELLAPSGMLCVAIPNLESLEASAFSRHWTGLDTPRHLVHFRERVLLRLLKRCGYTIERVRPQFFASSLTESFLCLLPTALRSKLIRSPLQRLLYLTMVFPAAVSYMFGNRAILEYRARKPAIA